MSANGYLNEGSFDDFWGGAGRDEIYIGDKPVPYYWLDTAKDATSEDNLHEIGWLGFVGHGQFYWTTCTARRFTSSHHQGRAEAGVRQESRGVMAPAFRYRYLPEVVAPERITASYIRTAPGLYPKVDPWRHPPGTNLLPTVFTEAIDTANHPIPNTLASTPTNLFNLHAKDPEISPLESKESPADDMRTIFERLYRVVTDRQYRELWQELDRPKTLDEHFLNPPIRPKESAEDYRRRAEQSHVDRVRKNLELIRYHLEWAVDIIEGNQEFTSKVPTTRSYRGFSLLHHSGHGRRTKRVQPVFNEAGEVVGGKLDVRLIYYGGRIESDTMYVDFGDDDAARPESERKALPKPIPTGVTWTITYTIDILNRGHDDFSTMALHFLAADVPLPNLGQDQSFFPMSDGTRTVVTVKMPPRNLYFLNYNWGWRNHPPRTQAFENGNTNVPPITADAILFTRRPNHERWVFSGYDPARDVPKPKYDDELRTWGLKGPSYEDRQAELRERFPAVGSGGAIRHPYDRISDLAPAKRMWRACKDAVEEVRRMQGQAFGFEQLRARLLDLLDARDAFLDWQDRLKLPGGIQPDPESDLTLLFVNNTIYGQFRRGGWVQHPSWRTRDVGNNIKITLINADYFPKGFLNIDFGGSRGWENQFKSVLPLGNSGPFFTFGRFHLHINTPLGHVGIEPAVLMEMDPKAKQYRKLVERDAKGVPVTRMQLNSDGTRTPVEKPIYNGRLPVAVQPQVHRIMLELNYEPSRRLRFYNFDPLHHDVAIFPVH